MANDASRLWALPDSSLLHQFETHYPQDKSYWISHLPSATSHYISKLLHSRQWHTASQPNMYARTIPTGENGPSSPPGLGSVPISPMSSTRFQSFKYFPTSSTLDSWKRAAARSGSTPSRNISAWWGRYLSQWGPLTCK